MVMRSIISAETKQMRVLNSAATLSCIYTCHVGGSRCRHAANCCTWQLASSIIIQPSDIHKTAFSRAELWQLARIVIWIIGITQKARSRPQYWPTSIKYIGLYTYCTCMTHEVSLLYVGLFTTLNDNRPPKFILMWIIAWDWISMETLLIYRLMF